MDDLYTKIKKVYPEIEEREFSSGTIRLQDDGDGIQYIAKWNYSKPLPDDLKEYFRG
jgi:hypothetical protein